jgi:hypothetical protein
MPWDMGGAVVNIQLHKCPVLVIRLRRSPPCNINEEEEERGAAVSLPNQNVIV